MKNKTPIFVFAILCITISSLQAQINASFTPSRTNGVAPLAVFFDASLTTSNNNLDAFHDLCYTWDFGDTNASTWTHSGKSQNIDSGPLAGHLFKVPGIYTVTLVINDNNGNTDTQNITITVNDPDVVFNGINTVCITQNSSNTGGPPGALYMTNVTNFNDVVAQLNSNKRVLLKRGETWTVNNINNDIDATNGIFGAFGNGTNNPIINCSNPATSDGLFRLSATGQLNDYIIQNLNLNLMTGSGKVDAFDRGNGNFSKVTFYNIQIDGFAKGISLPAGSGLIGAPIYEKSSIVECTIKNATGGTGSYGMFVEAENLLCMGNTIDSISGGEHCLRFPFLEKAVIGHNLLSIPAFDKHLIKLHAGDFTPQGSATVTSGRFSKEIVIGNNKFVGGPNKQNITIGPQSKSNISNDERVKDVIVEKNLFIASSATRDHLEITAQNVTVRNNVFNMNSSNYTNAIQVTCKSNDCSQITNFLPSHINIYNNTAVRTDNSAFTFIGTSNDVSNVNFCNNLAYSQGNTPIIHSGGGTSIINCGSNLAISSNIFTGTSFITQNDFQLSSTINGAFESGVITPVCSDLFDSPRTNQYDIGAHELSTTSLCETNLYIPNFIQSGIYQVSQTITSDGILLNGSDVNFKAGIYIDLLPGFEVISGSIFLAEMDPCTQ